MKNELAKKFTLRSLLKFAFPNVVMMVFLSLYTVVDGIFVSRYVGTTALSAINMVFPTVSLQMAISIMLATGSSAIVARKLGEGRIQEAKENFTFIVIVICLISIVIAIIGNVFIDQIIWAMGSSKAQFEYCKVYMRILFVFAPSFFLQTAFQTLFVTAGKPKLGLIVTILGGIANIVLDYLFIAKLHMGISGAAYATGIGYSIPAVVGMYYFAFVKNNQLHFTKPAYSNQVLLLSCANGSSEMVTNLANALTTFFFNYLFLKYYGEDGVASITIVLYLQFVFTAIYIGYSMGVAPVISYKYGAGDVAQLKSIFKNSLAAIIISSLFMYFITLVAIKPIMDIFAGEGTPVYDISLFGFPLYAVSFLFMGISIFASSFFTAFSDGWVSAVISFSRTFLFIVGAILILPYFMGKTGLWISVPTAELMGIIVSILYFISKKNKYKY